MGVALIIMAVHDALFRDEYNQHALDWMHGWKCVGAGTLAVVSAQVITWFFYQIIWLLYCYRNKYDFRENNNKGFR